MGHIRISTEKLSFAFEQFGFRAGSVAWIGSLLWSKTETS